MGSFIIFYMNKTVAGKSVERTEVSVLFKESNKIVISTVKKQTKTLLIKVSL